MGQIWQKDSWDIHRLVNWKGSILYGNMMSLVCDVWVLGDIQYSQLNIHDTSIWQDTHKDFGVISMKWLIGEIWSLEESVMWGKHFQSETISSDCSCHNNFKTNMKKKEKK